ncbi:hypothetical protein F8M41_003671 [Gigaspora margarita]|uniref:Peptidase A2 domain-containing protein n=1 Tax=Gigaspora margarita TaxID=4874 RepID=A0A8H3XCY0_GIGMA|nr:hypothetical protein F8M41_003671 [Gigaspora margarita]
MRRQLENLHINQTKMAKAMKKMSSKPKSSRRKTKSKSRTKKKKSSKRINAHIISDKSSSDSSNSKNDNTTFSENELETNTLALTKTRVFSSSKTSSESSESESSNSESDSEEYESGKDARPLKIPTDNISLNAFFAILRLIVDSFTCTQPKEVSINDKEHEKFWHEITMISSPLEKIVQVPSAMIDSGANCSVISKGLIKLLGAEVDKNKKPSVKWRNNSLESSGISYNISVMVGQGENSCTISEDFLVMDDDKPWILLGTSWLDRARWEPIVKRNSS